MKNLILVLTLMLSTTAFAQHHGHHGHHHRHGGYNSGWWIGPAIVGGVVTYALTRPQTAPQPTVIYTMPPPPPIGYQWETIHDVACNCLRTVLVPVQYGARSPGNGLQ